MRFGLFLTTTLLFFYCISGVALDRNLFVSQTIGLSFSKIDDWNFSSVEAIEDNREKIRLDDADIEQKMKTQASLPVVSAMKYPEPYPGLNPSFQIVFRPLGNLQGKSASELIELMLPTFSRAYPDFTIVQETQETVVDGLPAAKISMEFTLKTVEGGSFPNHSDIIIVPRAKHVFVIGMSRSPSDLEAAKDQGKMFANIKITP